MGFNLEMFFDYLEHYIHEVGLQTLELDYNSNAQIMQSLRTLREFVEQQREYAETCGNIKKGDK